MTALTVVDRKPYYAQDGILWHHDGEKLFQLSDMGGLATKRRSLLQQTVVITSLCVDSQRVWATTDAGALWAMPTRGAGANTWSLVFGSGTVKKAALDTAGQLHLMSWDAAVIWRYSFGARSTNELETYDKP